MGNALAWMAWTPMVAIFFVGVALMLIGMTIWEVKSPTCLHKGFLPIATTRGDRLFIGLLLAAYANLAWIGITDFHPWIGAGAGFGALLVVMRWG
jgi:predicted small integral membrane protein